MVAIYTAFERDIILSPVFGDVKLRFGLKYPFQYYIDRSVLKTN